MDKFTCGSHHVKIAPLWANAKSENSQRIFSHNPDKDTTVPFFLLELMHYKYLMVSTRIICLLFYLNLKTLHR